MTWFVKIKRLNGRRDLVALAEKLELKGFDDRVEYNEGGWADKSIFNVAPHLKFENEDDAIAYVLAEGGEITKELPDGPDMHTYPGG